MEALLHSSVSQCLRPTEARSPRDDEELAVSNRDALSLAEHGLRNGLGRSYLTKRTR